MALGNFYRSCCLLTVRRPEDGVGRPACYVDLDGLEEVVGDVAEAAPEQLGFFKGVGADPDCHR